MEDPDEEELEKDWMVRLDERSFWRRATRSDGVSVSGIEGREDEDEEKFNKLCEDKSAGELFRLKAGKDNCRDVIQCTAAVSLSTCKTIILI